MPLGHCSAALGLAAPSDMRQQLVNELAFFPTVAWVDHTDSTNGDLLAQARASSGQLIRPWLLGAHLQHKGRGRAGRVWQNRQGAHLMFSCAFDVFLPARRLATLSPLIGVAATEALRSLLPVHAAHKLTMKWPNDLLWNQAKLAGILTEVTRASTAPLSQDHHVIVMGIGINLNDASTLSQSLKRPIADWAQIVEEVPQIKHLTAAQLVAIIAKSWYQTLNEVTAFGFQQLPQRYAKVDGLKDQYLHVIDDGKLLFEGIGSGVNEQGQLLVRQGELTHPVSVGEISVRSLNTANPL